MENYQMLIGGESVDALSGERFDSVNPYTGEPWATLPRAGVKDVDRAVNAAHAAFTSGPWPKLSASARGALLRKVSDLIAEAGPQLSEIETRDNGKLIGETTFQAKYLPQIFHYYAGLADKIEGAVIPIEAPGILAYTKMEPVGVVAAITPWNSPLLIGAGKLANALAAGCTVVLKPSEFTSASSIVMAECFKQAGFPPGVVNVITGFGSEIGDALIGHPKVKKVTFTGSVNTGRRVNEVAASSFKKVSLELGGKSPNIVFDDANLENAVKGAIGGIFAASGQTCIAGSRLLLQDSIHDAFLDRLHALVKDIKVGDPRDPATQMGPIATAPQYEKVIDYFRVAKEDGATCFLGGQILPGKGQLVQPTIYTNVTNQMRIAKEEIFGPVLSVLRFKDEEEAIALANNSLLGLASGVWTSSMKRAFMMVDRIQAGTVWVNMYRSASFMMPLTGRKDSGLGSENGQDNIRNYLQPKAVWVNHSAEINIPLLKK